MTSGVMPDTLSYTQLTGREFAASLGAQRAKARSASIDAGVGGRSGQIKSDVVTVTRRDIALVDRYVRSREQQGREAKPAVSYIDQVAREQADVLKQKLRNTAPGREQAAEYQRLVLEILNFIFNPELIDGQPEVKTVDGTERRDIIFTNDSDESFWEYIRSEHAGILVMFEAKNVVALDAAAINQTATYWAIASGGWG